VTAAQLPKLLLSIDDVKHAVNAPNLAKVEESAGVIGSQGYTVTPSGCLSALFASTKEAYQHSLARTVFSRAITGEGQDGMVVLNESISTFENSSAATSFVSELTGDWRGCAGKSVTVAGKGNTITLDVGQPEANGAVMTLQNSLQGSLPGFSSDRAIAAKANVVIDLDAQGFDMGDALKTLADQILARVPSWVRSKWADVLSLKAFHTAARPLAAATVLGAKRYGNRISVKQGIRQVLTLDWDRQMPLPLAAVLNDRRKRPYVGQQQVIFASSSGTLRDPENFTAAWRAVRDELAMPDVTSHGFHKTVATLIDDAGLSARIFETRQRPSRPWRRSGSR
jgi:hypothetical protein